MKAAEFRHTFRYPKWQRSAVAIGIAAAALALTGCKVVTEEADREIRSRQASSFDAGSYVSGAWSSRFMPQYKASATDLAALRPRFAAGLGAAGGRQAFEGAKWTFVVRGQGVVEEVDNSSQVGSVKLAVPGAGSVRLLTGPVVVSTALRDALPSLRFDDFADQIAFAAVSKALNEKALASVRPVAARLEQGEAVSFLAVLQLAEPDSEIVLVPLSIVKTSGRSR